MTELKFLNGTVELTVQENQTVHFKFEGVKVNGIEFYGSGHVKNYPKGWVPARQLPYELDLSPEDKEARWPSGWHIFRDENGTARALYLSRKGWMGYEASRSAREQVAKAIINLVKNWAEGKDESFREANKEADLREQHREESELSKMWNAYLVQKRKVEDLIHANMEKYPELLTD